MVEGENFARVAHAARCHPVASFDPPSRRAV
jgi:hypothetical protein